MPTAYLSPSQLQDLTNVSSTAPGSGDNGKALVWNQAAGKWQAEQVAYTNLSGAPALPIPVVSGGTGTQTGSITGTGALTFAAGGTNQNVNITPSGTGELAVSGFALRLTQPSGNTNNFGLNFEKPSASGFFSVLNGTSGNTDFFPVFAASSTSGLPAMAFVGRQEVNNTEGVMWFSARNNVGNAGIANTNKAFVFSNFVTPRVTIDGSGDTVFLSTTDSTLTTNGAVRIDGGVGIAKNLNVGGTIKGLGAVESGAPNSPTAAGTQWQVRVDENYIYVCTQTGTAGNAAWKRVGISTWTP